MEARKWEDLPMDCLVDVLGRVGVESLLLYIPFVCKSWYKATLSSLCWKKLDFPNISPPDPFVDRFKRQYGVEWEISVTKLVKGVIDRSAGFATMVKLPSCSTDEALTHVADKCPALKKLVLLSEEESSMLALSSVICKFKKLESLEIRNGFLFKEIVTEIGANCKNFVSLSLVAVATSVAYIAEEEALAIVTCLPKIKFLSLWEVSIWRENLKTILKGCLELVHLDIGDWMGHIRHNKEIIKLASHIPTYEYSDLMVDAFVEYVSNLDRSQNCDHIG